MKKRLVFGWILLAIGLTPFLTFLFTSKPIYTLWFSNHMFIILGLAVLFNSRFWVLAEFCLGWFGELFWSGDYVYRLITGEFKWGVTQYMFTDGGAFAWNHLYSLQHLLFVPACIIALIFMTGPVKDAWLGSFAHFIVIGAISFQFPAYNLNCVIESCTRLTVPHYQFVWPLVKLGQAFATYMVVYGLMLTFSTRVERED